ncbi:YchJ family protein [Methylosoma difficile]
MAYLACCGVFHHGDGVPVTAEALMRSRYCAYALQDADYLQNTWHETKSPKTIDFSKENAQWLRLEIVETKKGGANDGKGVVSFKAFFQQEGEDFVMRETSRFVKEKGRWLYVDGSGAISKVADIGLQSKNGACPCGSGKKYKRCCGVA